MNSYRNIMIIFNPVSGLGAARDLLPLVRDRLFEIHSSAQIMVVETQDPGMQSGAQGSCLINDPSHLSQADLVVVIGGDGTLHGIVQFILALPSEQRPTLMLIPVGSGNDYALTLGISNDPQLILGAFAQGVEVGVDVGRCLVFDDPYEEHKREKTVYYLQTLSFGVDAAVAINTMELRKTTDIKGRHLYARAAISAITKELKPFYANYRIDGLPSECDLLICAVQNGPTYGSGFKIAPRASIKDGLLNICMARRMSKLRALYYLLRIKAGTHERIPAFMIYETPRFEIKVDRQLPIQCDGERLWGTHFLIDVLSDALKVLVPQTSPVLSSKNGE